jgi:RNA polymerase sigma-70 factor (ECF subfamily)
MFSPAAHGGISLVGRRGRDDAFVALYRAEWSRVRAAAERVVGNRAVAEELAQEAFTRAYDRWPKVSRHPAPAAWVLRVATNLALDAVRRKRVEVEVRSVASHEDAAIASVLVRDGLAVLSGKQREAIVLRYLAGCEEPEIAAAMGVSGGSVKTHLKRAMERLRASLGVELGVDGAQA